MGMSASQARLLTLTARMSDLEYSAQQISNSKLRLAVQSEAVSKNYSDALNKEKLSVLTGYNNTTSTYSDLSYENLCGKDSPLMDQYGLSTTNGKFLIPKATAAGYKDELGNPVTKNDFLVNMGEASVQYPDGYTLADYKAAQAKVAVSKPAYEAAIKDTSAKLKELNTYGEEHVKGYDAAGAWSYADTKGSKYSYTDQAVFQYLRDNSTIDEPYGSDSNYQAGGDTGVKSIMYMAIVESETTAAEKLANLVTDICSDTATALGNSVAGMDPDTFNDAVKNAYDSTQAHYKASNDAKSSWGDISQLDPVGYEEGKNQICKLGIGTRWVDINQMIKTFLTYFDQSVGLGTTGSNVGDLSTTRGTVDGTTGGTKGATIAYALTKNYDSVQNPDKIQYMIPTSEASKGVTESDVKVKYEKLLSDYKTAVQTEAADKDAAAKDAQFLEDASPLYTLDGAHVKYYTNIYDRMGAGVKGQDDYATVDNEDSTINNNEWLQNQMMNGNLRLEKVDSNSLWEKISYKSDTSITQDSNDRDLAKAEAEYSLATAEIETKDKKFDLQLKNVETEHTAVQTEVDSVKKVIDKNIDRSFKMFNA